MVKFTNFFALAGTAVVFAGMAYGQASCGATALNNVQIRGESTNDIVGDLRIKCTNSNVTGAVPAGTVNIQLFATTGVTFTSKIVDTTNGYSEALAFSNLTAADAKLADYSTPGVSGPTQAVLGTISPSGNSITFVGIPTRALLAGTADFTSILLTNIRVNASALAVSTGAPTQVALTAVVSGTPVFQVSIGSQQVAYIQYGLGGAASYNDLANTTAGTTNTTFVVCTPPAASGIPAVGAGGLMFNVKISENFPSAFRSAALEQSPLQLTGANTPTLNVPAATVAAGANAANNASRLKIVFTNVPSGVSLYTKAGGIPTTTGATAVLTYTTAETGAFAAATPVTLNTFAGYAAIPVSSGGATAVFDLTTNDPANLDTFSVPIYVQFAAGLPVSTTAISASVSFAPTGVPNNIPNFNAAAGSTVKLTGSTFNACSTSLLFPFVTNQLGFDTGIAISNTSVDPFGTKGVSGTDGKGQAGNCSLSFYGSGAPTPSTVSTPNVPGGTVNTFVLSGIAAGFQGYVIAQCNFQYAHGFAFITNGVGVNGGLSQGYLAGVIPDTNQTNRAANPASAGVNVGKGESLGN